MQFSLRPNEYLERIQEVDLEEQDGDGQTELEEEE